MKIISRNFPKMRGDAKVDYVFRTFEGIHAFSEKNSIFGKLCAYLADIFDNGIPKIEECKSVSELPQLICSAEQRDNQIVELAKKANARGNGKSQHDIIQNYFLVNDEFAIATEIPVWDQDKNVLGHIDLLRVVGDIVELWDYKPNAHLEKKAASQILRYRNMLAKCANIPLSNIQAGYFDEKNAYFLTFKK